LTSAHTGLQHRDACTEKICRSSAIAFPHLASRVHAEAPHVLHRCSVVLIFVSNKYEVRDLRMENAEGSNCDANARTRPVDAQNAQLYSARETDLRAGGRLVDGGGVPA
jgi:hypothetical protein